VAERLPLRLTWGAALTMFLWALCFPLISVGLAESPPMFFAALRAALSGVVLLAVAQWLGRPPVRGSIVWAEIVLVALTATSLGFFGMFYGGERVSPGVATVLSNTQPLIAAALARLALDEHLMPLQWCGLFVGFSGIVLVGISGVTMSDVHLVGVASISLGALGIAISNVALKRLGGRVDVLQAMGWQLLIGAGPLAALALLTEDGGGIVWSAHFFVILVVLSLLGTSAAFVLWFWLLERASLSRLNAFSFLTPIFGLLMGGLFFGERLSGLAIAGVVLSLLGIHAVNRASP